MHFFVLLTLRIKEIWKEEIAQIRLKYSLKHLIIPSYIVRKISRLKRRRTKKLFIQRLREVKIGKLGRRFGQTRGPKWSGLSGLVVFLGCQEYWSVGSKIDLILPPGHLPAWLTDQTASWELELIDNASLPKPFSDSPFLCPSLSGNIDDIGCIYIRGSGVAAAGIAFNRAVDDGWQVRADITYLYKRSAEDSSHWTARYGRGDSDNVGIARLTGLAYHFPNLVCYPSSKSRRSIASGPIAQCNRVITQHRILESPIIVRPHAGRPRQRADTVVCSPWFGDLRARRSLQINAAVTSMHISICLFNFCQESVWSSVPTHITLTFGTKKSREKVDERNGQPGGKVALALARTKQSLAWDGGGWMDVCLSVLPWNRAILLSAELAELQRFSDCICRSSGDKFNRRKDLLTESEGRLQFPRDRSWRHFKDFEKTSSLSLFRSN